jgi:hypothetical protein
MNRFAIQRLDIVLVHVGMEVSETGLVRGLNIFDDVGCFFCVHWPAEKVTLYLIAANR